MQLRLLVSVQHRGLGNQLLLKIVIMEAPVSPAESKVLVASDAWKNVEEITLGELVMGADGAPAEGVDPYVTKLGQRKMLSFGDDSIFWSEEHAFWTKDSGDKEWWWSAEPDTWRAEVEEGVIGGLKDNFTLRSGRGYKVAHLEGWKSMSVRFHPEFTSETPLFLPRTNGVPIIVNGYVVGASVNEFNYDYTQFTWKELR